GGMAHLERPDAEGSLEEAILDFRAALAQDEDFAPALAGLAWAYRLDHLYGTMDPHRLDQALAAAEQAVRINGHLALARISLGLVLLEKGDLDSAESELRRALELEPSNAEAWTGLGRAHEARKEWQEAESHYRTASELQPEEVEYLGLLYHRTGRYEEAARAFSRYLEISPDSFRTRSNLGVVLYMQGHLSEASEQFQKALEIRPDPTLYANIGTICFTQGLYARSVSAFEDALRHGGSNHYLLWGNLGDAHRWNPGQEEEARAAYRRAVQLLDEKLSAQPEDPTLRTRRVLYLAKLGDCDEAISDIHRLEGLPAEDGNAWFRLAVAHEVCRRRGDALDALEKALRARFSLEEIRRDPELLDLRKDIRYHRLASGSRGEEEER
ncbi:MAG: tetratricopeptide repeat protein, partial [Holophagales bacterium]|nr:tetratricopeptide repeat protein [Holophagales bacterium]